MPSSTALACARELLATEKTYAAGLKCFLDNFVYKLPKADAAVDRMSRNINGVLTVHESLGLANDKLAAQIVQEPCTAIVAVAESISKADFVQPYATCINDLETMEREVARLRKGRLHGDIAALERNLPLQSVSAYLIMPVQRIPRLIMMMATIEKGLTTDDICEHPDVKSQVDHALQSLSDCASLLNEAKRSKEIHDLLTSVVENSPDIQFNPLAGRRLLKHSGVQRDHKRSGLTAPTASHCLLFDDRVCVVNRKFQLKSDVVLAGTNVTVTQYDSPPGRHHTWRYGLMFQQGTSRPKSPLSGLRQRLSPRGAAESDDQVAILFETDAERSEWIAIVRSQLHLTVLEPGRSSTPSDGDSLSRHSIISNDSNCDEPVPRSDSVVVLSVPIWRPEPHDETCGKHVVSEPLQVISPAIAFVHWSVQVSIVPPDTVDVHSGLKAFEEWVCGGDHGMTVILFNTLVRTDEPPVIDISVIAIVKPSAGHSSRDIIAPTLATQFEKFITSCHPAAQPSYLTLCPINIPA